ncbi:MAG TPA: DUF3011 domain-containing protein [Blastocatellia bacterium]|nr:DUF3011 domain-containing protein [Blastocatellia bacterium]
MKNIGVRNVVHHNILFAVLILLAVVAASGSATKPLIQQSAGNWVIEQAQQAVQEQITSREGRRNSTVQFNNDAQTEYQSNAAVRVRGTGILLQNNNGRSRPFSYEAVVNNRNRRVSAIKYDWQDNWSNNSGGNQNTGYGIGSCRSATRWDETEAGYTGVWTRRGNSNVFDAVWTRDRQQVTAVLTITNQGNRVFVKRTSSSDGYLCEYEGTVAADGVTVTGTMRCPGNSTTFPWQATIDCRGADYQGQTISLASDDNRRHTYPVDTSGGVRLVRQNSGSPCVQGQTWGYNRNEIWVDRGCRADFTVGRAADSSGGSYVTNHLTGTYRLNQARSDNPSTIAERVTQNLIGGEQQRLRNAVLRRLESPEVLAIERRGRTITMASTRAAQVSFEADGREQTEQSRNGRNLRTKATLSGDRLVVSTEGDRSVDYQVTFEPIDNGRSLRVTRRISDEGLRQAVVAKSVYDKTSDSAQLNVYSGDRNDYPPINSERGTFAVPDGTQLIAVLSNNLSTKQTRDGEQFTLTVRSPSQYDGAIIEGHVVKVNRSGRVAGRAEMSLEFDRIQLGNGRTTNFAGYIESVRTTSGETIRVDNEGRVQEEGSQTRRTVTRTGIGAAIGAVIGAIAGGGKGAAIGAAVGAGAGAGSVYVQGRDDLDLQSGTEFTVRASAPR